RQTFVTKEPPEGRRLRLTSRGEKGDNNHPTRSISHPRSRKNRPCRTPLPHYSNGFRIARPSSESLDWVTSGSLWLAPSRKIASACWDSTPTPAKCRS